MSIRAHGPTTFAVTLALALASTAVMAQTQPPMTPSPAPAPGLTRGEIRSMGTMEGTLKGVDPGSGTVQVTVGLLGLIGRTLELAPDTQILVQGRQGSVADLRDGEKVRASYEMREGNNVATLIEIMSDAQTRSSDVARPRARVVE